MERVVYLWGLLLLTNELIGAFQPAQEISFPLDSERLNFVAFLTSSDGGVVCSATIVHENYVLTAASCFLTSRGDMISYHHKVLVGNNYKSIKQLLPHPAYRLQTNYYDVGLIRLRRRIAFGPAAGKIQLAKTEQMEVGDEMRTACWVMTNNRSTLTEALSHVITRSLCGHAPQLGVVSTSLVVCASVYDNCEVDLGTPLYDGGRQYGVASRRHNGRIMYTKVDRVRAWIVNVLYKDNMGDYFEDPVF